MELDALQFIAGRADLLGLSLAILGAAIACLLAGIGSCIGVSMVGQAGAGLLTEKPNSFGIVTVIEALPGSQGIYGMVIAFLFLTFFKIGTPEQLPIDFATGLSVLFACLPVAFTCLFSAPYQGKVCAAGMRMIAKDDKASGKVIPMAALVETYAILGFLISLFLLLNISNGLVA
jgi:V/A-type H+/Na+-transporting ATPase subunit K